MLFMKILDYEQKLTRTLANGSRQQPPAHFELKAAAIRRNNTFKIHLMNDEAIQIQGDSGRVKTFVIPRIITRQYIIFQTC